MIAGNGLGETGNGGSDIAQNDNGSDDADDYSSARCAVGGLGRKWRVHFFCFLFALGAFACFCFLMPGIIQA